MDRDKEPEPATSTGGEGQPASSQRQGQGQGTDKSSHTQTPPALNALRLDLQRVLPVHDGPQRLHQRPVDVLEAAAQLPPALRALGGRGVAAAAAHAVPAAEHARHALVPVPLQADGAAGPHLVQEHAGVPVHGQQVAGDDAQVCERVVGGEPVDPLLADAGLPAAAGAPQGPVTQQRAAALVADAALAVQRQQLAPGGRQAGVAVGADVVERPVLEAEVLERAARGRARGTAGGPHGGHGADDDGHLGRPRRPRPGAVEHELHGLRELQPEGEVLQPQGPPRGGAGGAGGEGE